MTLIWNKRQFYPSVCLNALEVAEMLKDGLDKEELPEFTINLLCDMTEEQLRQVKTWIEESGA